MKKLIILMCIILSLTGCSQASSQGVESENAPSIETSEESGNSEDQSSDVEETDEIDIELARGVIHKYMADSQQHEFDVTAKAYSIDITNDGQLDALFVSSSFGPVGVVVTDGDVYKAVEPFVYADGSSEFEKSGPFLIEHISRSDGEYSKNNAVNIYWYDGEGMTSLLESPLTLANHDMVNFLTEEYVDGTGSIAMDDGYSKFTYRYSSTYTDRRANIHPFKEYEISYVFSEAEGTYDKEVIFDKSTAEYAFEIADGLDFTGTNENLRSFEAVYDSEDLEAALRYYWNNQYDFTESEKIAYQESAFNAVVRFPKGNQLGDISDDYWTYFESLLNQFDTETMTIHDFDLSDIVGDKDASVFTPVYVYFATEGYVESEGGLGLAVLDTELSKIIKVIAHDYDAYVYDAYLADMNFTDIEEVLSYPVAYPHVVIDDLEDLKAFEHKDVWKTTIMLPVKTEKNMEDYVETDVIPSVSAGSSHALALKIDGSLWAWGSNDSGQLGTGLRTTYSDEVMEATAEGEVRKAFTPHAANDVHAPVKVMDNIIKIAAGGRSSYAITSDHELYAWGANQFKQLGIDGENAVLSPVKIMDGVVFVSASRNQAAVIKEDQSLWYFGLKPEDIEFDEQGDIIHPVTLPVKVMDNVEKVSVTDDAVMALQTDGRVYMWGDRNAVGLEYSEMDEAYVLEPVLVFEGAADISCEDQVNMVVDQSGTLYSWGYNGYDGKLGTGTDEFYTAYPTEILTDVSAVTPSGALLGSGNACVWGTIDSQYDTMTSDGFVGGGLLSQLIDFGKTPKVVFENAQLIDRSDRLYVIDQSGILWGMGTNQFGKLGDGSVTTFVYTIDDSEEYAIPEYSLGDNNERDEWVRIMNLK